MTVLNQEGVSRPRDAVRAGRGKRERRRRNGSGRRARRASREVRASRAPRAACGPQDVSSACRRRGAGTHGISHRRRPRTAPARDAPSGEHGHRRRRTSSPRDHVHAPVPGHHRLPHAPRSRSGAGGPCEGTAVRLVGGLAWRAERQEGRQHRMRAGEVRVRFACVADTRRSRDTGYGRRDRGHGPSRVRQARLMAAPAARDSNAPRSVGTSREFSGDGSRVQPAQRGARFASGQGVAGAGGNLTVAGCNRSWRRKLKQSLLAARHIFPRHEHILRAVVTPMCS